MCGCEGPEEQKQLDSTVCQEQWLGKVSWGSLCQHSSEAPPQPLLTHMIISLDAEEAFDKIKGKNPRKTRESKNMPQHFKSYFLYKMANIMLKRRKTEIILLKIGTRQGCPLSPLLNNIVLHCSSQSF